MFNGSPIQIYVGLTVRQAVAETRDTLKFAWEISITGKVKISRIIRFMLRTVESVLKIPHGVSIFFRFRRVNNER